MLIVIPVSLSDRHLIPVAERAFELHPPGSGHELLVVGSPDVTQEVRDLAQRLCIHFAGNAKTHVFETDCVLGWPMACNYYFQQVAFHLPTILPAESLWFWCELDCTPLKAGWLDDIEKLCNHVRVQALRDRAPQPQFFGGREHTYQEFRGELIPFEQAGQHMAPCGVYPSNMVDWVITVRAIAATNIPWYTFIQWYVLESLHDTDLIQNNWKTDTYERQPDGRITCKSKANWAWDVHFNADVSPDAVLVHGCKDGSLTDLLKAEHEALQAEGVAPADYWTDFRGEVPSEPENGGPPARRQEPPKKVTRSQITAAKERLKKLHEDRRAALGA